MTIKQIVDDPQLLSDDPCTIVSAVHLLLPHARNRGFPAVLTTSSSPVQQSVQSWRRVWSDSRRTRTFCTAAEQPPTPRALVSTQMRAGRDRYTTLWRLVRRHLMVRLLYCYSKKSLGHSPPCCMYDVPYIRTHPSRASVSTSCYTMYNRSVQGS